MADERNTVVIPIKGAPPSKLAIMATALAKVLAQDMQKQFEHELNNDSTGNRPARR